MKYKIDGMDASTIKRILSDFLLFCDTTEQMQAIHCAIKAIDEFAPYQTKVQILRNRYKKEELDKQEEEDIKRIKQILDNDIFDDRNTPF